METLENDILLKVLYINSLLSCRGFTVCKEIYEYPTLNNIIRFYQEYGTFIKIRNCGFYTNNELKSICENAIETSAKLEKILQQN